MNNRVIANETLTSHQARYYMPLSDAKPAATDEVAIEAAGTLLTAFAGREVTVTVNVGGIEECYLPWRAGEPVVAGDFRHYGGKLYRCYQPHTTQSDWTPDAVPALWVERAPPGVIPEWKQPAGAHDAYQLGDKVRYGGKIWESTINANVWAPGVYGWKEVAG